MKFIDRLKYFSLVEWLIWSMSVVAIVVSFFVFHNTEYHYLVGSLIGVTALIFITKGNPIGEVLTIVFSVFYGIISYSFAYYGEMITYLGMSAPMAVVALVLWLRNPHNGNHSEIKVNILSKKEWAVSTACAAVVTVAFYFILRALGTTNLIVSTLSVMTSFFAAYLTARRSRFYGVAYAANDIVLIVMWVLASIDDITYLPMVICFVAFIALDVYGFVNWSAMRKKQAASDALIDTHARAETCAQTETAQTIDADAQVTLDTLSPATENTSPAAPTETDSSVERSNVTEE